MKRTWERTPLNRRTSYSNTIRTNPGSLFNKGNAHRSELQSAQELFLSGGACFDNPSPPVTLASYLLSTY